MPGWDNTPRRLSQATIYLGSSPRRYARWLQRARAEEAQWHGDAGLVFINAWNEWAEGAFLEPDATHGDEYLKATRHDYICSDDDDDVNDPRCGRPTLGWLVSLTRALAGSAYIKAQKLTRAGASREQ